MLPASHVRKSLCLRILALLFALSGPLLAEEGPSGSPGALSWVSREIYGIADQIAGLSLLDLRTPAVPDTCNGRLRSIWEFNEFQGAAAPQLTHCSLTGAEFFEECDAANSGRPLDLDQPVDGHSGEFYWLGLDASHGSTCLDTRYAAAILADVNPPQNPFIAHLTTGFNATTVTEYDELIPDGDGSTYQVFSYVAAYEDKIAFAGSGSGGRTGIYAANPVGQPVFRVVDNTMTNPGGVQSYGPATSVLWFARSDTQGPVPEQLIAWSDGNGIYVSPPDLSQPPTQLVATGDSYAPSRTVRGGYTQLAFVPPNRIAFKAQSQTFKDGIYSVGLDDPHVLRRHADNETTYGGGAFGFGPLQNPSGAGDSVFFEAFTPAFVYRGAFVDVDAADGEVEPLLLRDDPLDGRTVRTVVVNPRSAVRSDKSVLLIYFTDNSAGIFATTQALFVDDFESGGTGRWSLTIP